MTTARLRPVKRVLETIVVTLPVLFAMIAIGATNLIVIFASRRPVPAV